MCWDPESGANWVSAHLLVWRRVTIVAAARRPLRWHVMRPARGVVTHSQSLGERAGGWALATRRCAALVHELAERQGRSVPAIAMAVVVVALTRPLNVRRVRRGRCVGALVGR